MDDHTSHHQQCKEEDKKQNPVTPFLRTHALPSVMLQQKRVVQLPLRRSITNLSTSSLFDSLKPSSSDGSSAAGGVLVSGVNNNGWDDENFDYIITPGDILDGRYRIKEGIGKGSFGRVVHAEDMESSSNQEVAIKIIRSTPPFLKQSETEIELLVHVREKDPDDQHNIVRLLTHFVYRNHQCLVFEMMSMNLYELLKTTQFRGFPLRVIQDFALQLLKTLSFLSRDDVDIIHCDLKPENILLRHPDKNEIKVIDFGSSCRSNQCVYPYIQSRAYRSPEVLLGLPYTAAIDMWSLGCILVEMHTGTLLFQARDQFDQMQKIVKLLGMIPGCMLTKATDEAKTQFFQRNEGDWNWHLRQTKEVPSSPSSNAATATMAAAPVAASSPWKQAAPIIVPSLNPIASLTKIIITPGLASLYPIDASNSQRNYTLFIDLIYKMLAYDPAERIKPADALKHPFFALEEASTVATPTFGTASTARAASEKPKKRKLDSQATASNNLKQQDDEEHPPLQQQQQQPQPIVRNEPSFFERLRRVFR